MSQFDTNKMVDIIKGVFSKIVTCPEGLEAHISLDPESVIVSIYPNPKDMGSIIGKEGKNIKAIRSLLASYALVNDDKRKIFIEVDCDDTDNVSIEQPLDFSTFNDDITNMVKAAFEHTLAFPDQLKVSIFAGERVTVLTITPNPEDIGRVIGRKGQNANAIKTFLDSYTFARNDRRKFFVEVKAPGEVSSNVEKGIEY
jgi:predicted RNA-binding protein YlqC (UPF0109 family)